MDVDLDMEMIDLGMRVERFYHSVLVLIVTSIALCIAVVQLFATGGVTFCIVMGNAFDDWAAQVSRGRGKRCKLFQPEKAEGTTVHVKVTT